MEIRILLSESERKAGFAVMQELREGLSLEQFLSIYEKARTADTYTLVGLYIESECAAVMGFRILYDYAHGKHLYIDDLVTTASRRGQGLGAHLLRFAELEAERLGCSQLRLCTGIANEGGKKFYDREGWQLRSVAYKKKC